MTIYLTNQQLEDYTTTLASVPIEQLNPPYIPSTGGKATQPSTASNKEIYIAAAALFVLVLFSLKNK